MEIKDVLDIVEPVTRTTVKDGVTTTTTDNVRIIGREYLTPDNQDTLVVFLHGVGERGPLDGSELWEVEKISGWPKYAKGTRPKAAAVTGNNEYRCNIFAVQVKDGYHYLHDAIIPAMVKRYNPKNIILAGISMGGYGVFDILSVMKDERVKVVINCCGASDRLGSIHNWHVVKGLSWHSTDDATVSFDKHRTVVDAYNSKHKPKGGHIYFNTLTGVGHGAWNRAFKAKMEEDESLRFAFDVLGLSVTPPVNEPAPTPAPEPTPEPTPAFDLPKTIDNALAALTELAMALTALKNALRV